MSGEHHHRSLFSSKNRPFKGKSKGKAKGGKVDNSSALASGRSSFSVASSRISGVSGGTHRIPVKHAIELPTKEARFNRAKQLQKNAREQLFLKKRIGARQGPPKCIALIPLGAAVDLAAIVSNIKQYADETQEGVAEEMKKVEKSTNPLLQTIAVKSVTHAHTSAGVDSSPSALFFHSPVP